jgi:hypothetical protein
MSVIRHDHGGVKIDGFSIIVQAVLQSLGSGFG